MTRINTNVSSLIAQKTLSRSNSDLQTSLTRLSTGLRINAGKDDPAGLIASENLRRDITSIQKAISNSERANQLIATADSALGQVSSLLNDIRGLVTEAANSGALSEEQIAANQLQVDSSLEAIDRIAQVATFQGRKLLDGSLDFITGFTAGGSTVADLKIDQANLGASGQVSVDIDITAAAEQAALTGTVGATTPAVAATGVSAFTAETVTAVASDFDSGPIGVDLDDIVVTFAATGDNNAVVVNISEADLGVGAAPTADYTAGVSLDIVLNNNGGATTTTFTALETAIEASGGGGIFNVTTGGAGDGALEHVDLVALDGTNFANGVDGQSGSDVLTVTSTVPGAAPNGATVTFIAATGHGATPTAAFNGNNIEVTLDDALTTTFTAIASAISLLSGYTAVASQDGDNNSDGDFDLVADIGQTITIGDGSNGGTVGADVGGGLADTLTFKLAGLVGAEVFSFDTTTSIAQIVNAVNLVKDATGVEAASTGTDLTFTSTNYGAKAFVDVEVISEGSSGTFESALSATRTNGVDISATVNGFAASGNGNTLSINSTVLDLSLTVTDGSTTDISFDITGGGALFQLGPDVVSNQQARIGINSLNTAELGGVSGRLFELRSGGDKDLSTNANAAANVVDEVINKVTSLRGRLGAFQKTTLETNIFTLNDTLASLTEAESSIRDADFAAESARLTRAQILVQSGTSVLAIANQNPQNVLALLR